MAAPPASTAATSTTEPGRRSSRDTMPSRVRRLRAAKDSSCASRALTPWYGAGRNQRPRAGIRNTATPSDAISETTTVKAMPSIRRAAKPCTKSTGRKTTQVVKVLATMAPATWPVPLAAAVTGSSPRPTRRYMDSTTTMALSTSIPAPRARPPRVTMLMLWSAKVIRNRAVNTDTGTAAATINVAPAERRNRASTHMASTTPAPAAIFKSSRASVTRPASLAISWVSTPGRSSWSPASASLTSSATPTVFAPASL